MTTLPKPFSSFETRGAKDADPATAALVEDIGLARETDYFLMRDQLTDQEKRDLAKVREFGEAEILPIVNDYWERGEFPFELIPKLAALNIVGDYNLGDHGCTPMTAVAAGLVTYELSRIDGSIATFFGVHLGLAMQSINILGSEEQRAALPTGDGAPGKDRRVRPDRARARLRRRHPRGHRGAARR